MQIQLAKICSHSANSLPNMLALYLMFSGTYYAKNYAGIISQGLRDAQQQTEPLIAIAS